MGRDYPEEDSIDPSALVDVDDAVFSALRRSPRRFVLYYLIEHGTASVDELADVVTGWSNAGASGMATDDERDRIHTALVHRHLPELTEAGLVEWDRSAGQVDFDVDSPAVVDLLARVYRREAVTR